MFSRHFYIFVGAIAVIPVSFSLLSTNDLVNFLQDIRELYQPFQIIAFMCLTTEQKLSLYKKLPFQLQYVSIEDHPIRLVYNQNWRESLHHLVMLVDLQCKNAVESVEDAEVADLYRYPVRWIMLGENHSRVPNIEALSDSNILFVEDGDQLRSFYKIRPSFPYIFEYLGNWASNGINMNWSSLIVSRRRRNFRGAPLKASIVLTQNQSITHLENYKEKHIDSIAKKDFAITKVLVASLNATLDFSVVETWGYYNPESQKWSGMIGDLTNGESDIGGTSLFFQPSRIQVIDYISMVTSTTSGFLFRAPPLSSTANIYLLPFSSLVWIMSGGLVVFAVLLIFVILKVQKNSLGLEENQRSFSRITDGVLVGISAISQMGLILQPKSLSSRIISIFVLIALLFLYTSYTANIVALLQSTAKTITSLQDLMDSNIELGLDDNPYNRYYFRMATEPIRKKLYETKLIPAKRGTFLNTSTGIDLLRGGSFGFHVELSVGYELIEKTFFEHEKCNLKNIEFLQVIDPWYSIRKKSSFKEILKVNLFKIREHGIQAREHAKIYTKQPACAAHGQNFGSVGFSECYWPFIVLLVGFGISFGFFIMEKVWSNSSICLM